MNEKTKMQRNQPATDDRDKQRDTDEVKNKKNKVLPEETNNRTNTNTGSMSEGNLSNDRFSRTRTRTPHDKTFTSGSDDDGQAV